MFTHSLHPPKTIQPVFDITERCKIGYGRNKQSSLLVHTTEFAHQNGMIRDNPNQKTARLQKEESMLKQIVW